MNLVIHYFLLLHNKVDNPSAEKLRLCVPSQCIRPRSRLFAMLAGLLHSVRAHNARTARVIKLNDMLARHPGLDLFNDKPSQNPARHCVDLEKLIKTDDDKKAILEKINSRRNKVAAGEIRSFPAANNMLKLEWNKILEQSAQRWANQCVKNSAPDIKDACRDVEGMTVGQNIATVYGESPGLLPTALVDVWYMELLNSNGSILLRFRESSEGSSPYNYFTQLVWADTSQVGCGGVKFKERLQDQDGSKNRTVYRLVCNFAPSGNRLNQSVYSIGAPCSKCPDGMECDTVYSSLCSKATEKKFQEETVHAHDYYQHHFQEDLKNKEISIHPTQGDKTEIKNISETLSDLENYTPFDYFSHLAEFTRPAITATPATKPECKDVLAVDDFIELLKKRLSSDHMFKELLLATKTTQGFPDTNFTDPNVAAFIKKLYSKKEYSTTPKSTENDLLNSTLLVNLVEAVIFRNSDKEPTSEIVEQSTHIMSDVNPVKIQAELAQVQRNDDFTGHYFFPEDDEESTTSEATEFYYDGSNPSIADILLEIEDIKKNTITKNFLDDILDFEPSAETTTTILFLSPDDMNAHKSGHEVMKKFLDEIKEKSERK